MDINGMAAVVTGGASGLGLGTAKRLVAAGAKVTLLDVNADLGASAAAEIKGHFVRTDITDEGAVDAALGEAEATNGKARILVNCAGIGPPAKVVDRDGRALPLIDFSRIVTVNLLGTFNVLSKFAARLHDSDPIGEERGVIVNIASVAAFDGQIGQAAYAASKGRGGRHDAADRARARALRHPGRNDRVGAVPDAASRLAAAGRAWVPSAIPQSAGAARRVRTAGGGHHHQSHARYLVPASPPATRPHAP